MKSTKIALFANKDSAQLLEIRDAVEELGATPIVLDIKLGGEQTPQYLIAKDRLLWQDTDFSDIKVIHIRCTALNTWPCLPPVLNQKMYSELRTTYLKEQEYQAAVSSFFECFRQRGGLVINPLTSAYIDHDTKSQMYEKLRALDFDTPRSITTSDESQAIQFIKKYKNVVVKPTVGIGSTRVVTQNDIDAISAIQYSPVLFQEQIIGHTHRIHIVGDKVVLALKIFSSGGVDSRSNTEKFEYVKLPDVEEKRIVKATHVLGLHYAAWDIIVSENGRYVYLDCNPGPFIMWIGKEYRKVIFNQLAKFMITYSETGSILQASKQVRAWKPD